jgi:FtsP/CotA-like multicopper oxidase with cupredoxin domain
MADDGSADWERFNDQNPASGIAEFQIVAAPSSHEFLTGKSATVWSYHDGSQPNSHGSIPGPLIEVNQGEHVIVHFRNELPDSTTIHWHGLRVPNASDGTPSSQRPVAPGGGFDYEFDASDAGLFWFHPHVQGDVQIERGLYAPLIVRSADEPAVDVERLLVLDDIKIEANGQLSTTTDALDVMLGRQGNVVLVNGKPKPRYRSAAGSIERWRILNVANGRYFNLSLPEHEIRVIGWDGGFIPEAYSVTTLLVAPGERYDVLVSVPNAPGSVVPLQTIYYDRGHDIPNPGPIDLLQLAIGSSSASGAEPKDAVSSFEPIAIDATTPIEELVLSETEDGPEPRFLINQQQFPDTTPLLGTPGAIAIWDVRNDSEMDHPFHLHGMFFQVLDVNGTAPDHQGLKDTLNIPQKSNTRLAIRYGSAGDWMFHCHILEHAERGMMAELHLGEP